MSIKDYLDYLFSRKPLVYRRILGFEKNPNREKMLFLALVRDGNTIFDIGANDGYYTLLFSNIAGPKGAVHAFEPVPPTFEKLKAYIGSKKNFNNTYLNNIATGDEEKHVTLYMPGDYHGQASTMPHTDGFWSKGLNVTSYNCRMETLDAYVAKKDISRIDFVNLDIEGSELNTLKGFANSLSRYHPILYMEISYEWSKDFGYRPPDIVRFLKKSGYADFFVVTDKICRVSNPDMDLAPERLKPIANLLCVSSKKNENPIFYQFAA